MKNKIKQILKMILFVPIVILAIPIFVFAIIELIFVQIINICFKWVADVDSNLIQIDYNSKNKK